MADVVRIGVVGAGSVAVRGILPHLAEPDLQDRVRLAAVCDPVPGRAVAAARRFGVERAFESIEELLDQGDVDAVSIASPIALHYEQGRLALQAGKHVHFNKTMTTTVSEATELIDLARQHGLKIVASPGEMLQLHNRRIKDLIAQGALGKLCWAAAGVPLGTYHEDEAVRGGADILSNIDPSWYFRKPGGGPQYDVAVYALHGLTGVLGPARRVTAFSGQVLLERPFQGRMLSCDADDTTLMLLDFGNSLFAFVYGTVAGRVTRGFSGSYFGTDGSIVGFQFNGRPLDLPGGGTTGDGYSQYRTLPHVVGPHQALEEMHVYEDVMQLVDWIREDRPSIVTAEHARHVIEIIDGAYRAAETGQTQQLTTTF